MPETSNDEREPQTHPTMMEWARAKYNEQYEAWMPWIEDTFLKYFTKDNRTSYATRDQLEKTKVTGVDQVDALQDKTNDLAASQLGQGGLLQPVGDVASEGMKRAGQRGAQSNDGKNRGGSAIDKSLNVAGVPALGL